MGADNSRLFSPSEEDEFYPHGYRKTGSERKEATTTTIDVGFAIRASRASLVSSGESSMLQRMVRNSNNSTYHALRNTKDVTQAQRSHRYVHERSAARNTLISMPLNTNQIFDDNNIMSPCM